MLLALLFGAFCASALGMPNTCRDTTVPLRMPVDVFSLARCLSSSVCVTQSVLRPRTRHVPVPFTRRPKNRRD